MTLFWLVVLLRTKMLWQQNITLAMSYLLMLAIYLEGWAELRVWPHSLSSVAFFLENQAERRKSVLLFQI